MNAITKHEDQPSNVAEYSGGLLDVISRAARDPNVDIEKMERLMAMQERILERDAKIAFTSAKIAMRPCLPEISMKGKIVIRDKNDPNRIIQETPFARFEDIHEAVTPILTEHGFDLAFKNGLSDEGKVRIITILSHVQGHSEETYFDLPHDSSGSKNAVQAVGSSTSYGKRYGVLNILNIRVRGEDDDAVSAVQDACISKEQRDWLLSELDETRSDKERFAKYMGVDSIADILAVDWPKAKSAIASKRKEAGK